MTDGTDLERLSTALKSAAPQPEAGAKARAMALALHSFDHAHAAAVPATAGPRPARLAGLSRLMESWGARPALAATASAVLVAIGLAAVLPLVPARGPAKLPPAPSQAEAPPNPAAAPPAATQPEAAQPETAQPETVLNKAAPEGPPLSSVAVAEPAPAAPLTARLEPAAPAEPATAVAADVVAPPDEMPAALADPAPFGALRQSLDSGTWPRPDQIDIPALVNAVSYGYPAPDGPEALRPAIAVLTTPWDRGSRLVIIGLQAGSDGVATGLTVQLDWNPAEVGQSLPLASGEGASPAPLGLPPGGQVTFIYQVTPATPQAMAGPAADLGILRLGWTDGQGQTGLALPIMAVDPIPADARLAAALAGFGLLLQQHAGPDAWSWDALIALASDAMGPKPSGNRANALALMQMARTQAP